MTPPLLYDDSILYIIMWKTFLHQPNFVDSELGFDLPLAKMAITNPSHVEIPLVLSFIVIEKGLIQP